MGVLAPASLDIGQFEISNGLPDDVKPLTPRPAGSRSSAPGCGKLSGNPPLSLKGVAVPAYTVLRSLGQQVGR